MINRPFFYSAENAHVYESGYERDVTLNSHYMFDFDWRQKTAALNL